MSEFLIRGWNVAIPEVDIGDDIFVVEDKNGILKRVQVKTSSTMSRRKSYSAQYSVPLKQLRNITANPVYYVFLARTTSQWSKSLVIRQDFLFDHFNSGKIGSVTGDHLNLYCSYAGDSVTCSGIDMTRYIDDFTDFPIIEH